MLLVAMLSAACNAATGSLAPASPGAPAVGSVPPPAITASPSPTAPAFPPGLLAVTDLRVAFLQWTRTDAAITGSLTEVYVNDYDHVPLNDVLNFTGTISSDSVAISLAGGQTIGGSSTLTGALKDGQLTLTYPAKDGTIATLTLVPGTVGDYNTAVAAFHDAQATAFEAQLEAEASAEAQASAEASASAAAAAKQSCAVTVLNHDATAIVWGDNAPAACRKIASSVSFSDGTEWGAVVDPAPETITASIVCGGAWNGVRVIVWDTGGQTYGSETCAALPLIRAYLGIMNTIESQGGLKLAPWTDSDGKTQPALVAGGPFAKAGLRTGDVIVALDTTSVTSDQELTNFLAWASPGQVVEVSILRSGNPRTIDVTLGKRPTNP